MANLFGALGLADRDNIGDTVNQRAIWDIIQAYLNATEAEVNAAYQLWVQEDTILHKERYYLPSGGELQAADTYTRPGAEKLSSSWDVAYPIEDGRTQIADDEITMAYMTAAQLSANVVGASQRYVNWRRRIMLRALLNKTNETFTDKKYGSLTVTRLANADGTLYPPVLGASTDLASHNHYVGLNYVSASISDTNNPFVTLRDHLEEHFGLGRIVAWINNAERAKVEALTAFVPVTRLNVIPGDNTATVSAANLPNNIPGRLLGTVNDVAVYEYRWIPAGYILGEALDQPGPLKRRLDEITSLQGFKLVATDMEYPFLESFYRAREGYGAGNRLNAVAMQLVASTTYSTPTAYA